VRIEIISPFVDRQHGTERAIAELAERLAFQHRDSVHLFSQRVSDLRLSEGDAGEDQAGLFWHRVPALRGPHLLGFVAWLFLNRRERSRVALHSRQQAGVTFSPGINALDADVIQVHAVFHRLVELQSAGNQSGLRGLHRRIYYALLRFLERRIYRDPRVILAAGSKHTADQIQRYIGRNDVAIIPHGVDHRWFSPQAVQAMRAGARKKYRCEENEIILLLIGNDWRNKGLNTLLAALARCADLPLRLLVAGQDEPAPMRAEAARLGIGARVEFLAPLQDVRELYAAADILTAPSREDSFNFPVLEAMSCGLPTIVSSRAGMSYWLKDGEDTLLLRDPEDAEELAGKLRELAASRERREELARAAQQTAAQFSWDRHAADLRQLLLRAAERKHNAAK